MKYCVVNVAIGSRYQPMSARMITAFHILEDPCPVLQWTNCLPPGAPTGDIPFVGYASKPFAMLEAVRQGFDIVLWLDSACYPIRHTWGFFDHIAKHGYYVQDNGFPVGRWCSDDALETLGITRDEAFGIPEISTMVVGLDVRKSDAMSFLQEWAALAADGKTFLAAHANDHGEVLEMNVPRRTVGRVSEDPRVWGHRHDQTAASVLAHRRGWTRTPKPQWVDYYTPTPDPRTVIINRGGF